MISFAKRIMLPVFFLLNLAVIQAQHFSDLKVEKLASTVNSAQYDEISPVLSRDGRNLYFTRVGSPEFNKTLVEGGQNLHMSLSNSQYQSHLSTIFSKISKTMVNNPEASSFNQDIFVAHSPDGHDFHHAKHPGYPLNNALPNSACALTPNGNEIVLINQFNQKKGGMNKGFSISRKVSHNNWTFPEPINIRNYHNDNSDVSMAMSLDGQIIVLSMHRGDSRGESDLYISFKTGPNDWTMPINLGDKLNTSARETTPFLSANNKKLYFSSNREGSMGGNDLYYVERLDTGWSNWSAPQQLEAPINSVGDDSSPIYNSATGYLYFTSNRDGTSDIFRVMVAPPNPVTVTVKGKILNSKTMQPIGGPSTILTGFNQPSQSNLYISEDGNYKMTVPKGGEFFLLAEKSGFRGTAESVNFRSDYVYLKEYKVDLLLEPMEEGFKIDLNPIYFERSKPNILDDSFASIDELALWLKQNRNINIVIEGHTDNQGEIESLKQLSSERAEAIKEYLVYKKRIHPLRIETIGFGPEVPVNDNSTEDLRSMNRRVEVKIAKVYDQTNN